MGQKFRFFDSIDGEDEREYTADEFAEYFRQFIRNGIFTGGENLKVETDEQDMKVYIKPGYAFIEGYLYKIDTESLVMQHNIADPSLNRIDRIIIRLDKTLENRYVKAFILEGTPAETPQVPELTRDSNIYEISLAQIEIIAGKSFIESYQITDERLNNDVCGITTHLFEQVDTTDIFNEWQSYLDFKKNESNVSYSDFVIELQSKLNAFQQIWDDWVEDKISEPCGEFYAQWKAWFNEIEDITNLVTISQFNNHLADDVHHRTQEEKDKLTGIEENANNYSHPIGSGSEHIPSGGVLGQLLKNIGDGKAAWGENDYTIAVGTATFGGGSSKSINVGFQPDLVILQCPYTSGYGGLPMAIIQTNKSGFFFPAGGTPNMDQSWKLTSTGFTVGPYSGVTFYYMAIKV